MKSNDQTLPQANSSKKAYSQPQLMVYGSLNHITQMLGNLGVLDGPKMKIDKTNA